MRVESGERATVASLGVVANKDWLAERDAGCRLARVGGPKVLGGVLFAGYGPLLALGETRLFPFTVGHSCLRLWGESYARVPSGVKSARCCSSSSTSRSISSQPAFRQRYSTLPGARSSDWSRTRSNTERS